MERAEVPQRHESGPLLAAVYALTPEGVVHLEKWLAEAEDATPYLQSTVYTKVVLARLSGRSADQILDT